MSAEIAQFQPPRLPYHDAIAERFGVDRGSWKVLVEAIFPAAKSVDAVVMALAYCRQRGLDPFKRPVHIVPMWSAAKRGYVETVWPSIAELRTTAFRTGQYAGCSPVTWGDAMTRTFTGEKDLWESGQRAGVERLSVTVTFPSWGQMTVYRMIGSHRAEFVGARVYWEETYGRIGKTEVPNEMWERRPWGQMEKCVEAAALRRAFPEEIGNEYAAEEMEGQAVLNLDASPPAAAPKRPQQIIHVPESRQGRGRHDKPAEEPESLDHMQGSPGEDLHTLGEFQAAADHLGPMDSAQWRKLTLNLLETANTEAQVELIDRTQIQPVQSEMFPGDVGDVVRARDKALERVRQ